MSKSTTGLGRGLDSLIPNNFDASLLVDKSERVQNLFIKDIRPNPDQPRRHFDTQALEELSQSIKRFGILQPLIVTPGKDGEYLLVAGERRWRASQLVGLDKVPAIVRAEKELEQLEISLIENVQRVDLSPLEQAISIERLHQQFNMSYNDVSTRLGKAATTINNIVRLLQLPEDARAALQEGKITEGHARAILALKGQANQQKALLEHIVKEGWSVRQAEQFVQTQKRGIIDTAAVKKQMAVENEETKSVAKRLHTKVTIKRTAKGGKIEIHFKTDDDLDRLIGQLGKI